MAELTGGAERTFDATTDAIGRARRFVRASASNALERADRGRDLAGDLELAVSELVTNAIEYGRAEPVTVSIVEHVAPARVVVSVRSARTSSGITDPTTWSSPLPAVRTGRGLAIVRSVSDEVEVEADASTVTVRCVFHLE